MQSVFISTPLSLLFIAAVVLIHITGKFSKKHTAISHFLNVTVHIATLIAFLTLKAQIQDYLIILLLSIAISLHLDRIKGTRRNTH